MGIVLILWASIVTSLTNQTAIYQKCKDVKCEVKINKVGYEIVEAK